MTYCLAKALPSYWLAQAGREPLAGSSIGWVGRMLAIWTAVFAVLGARAYRVTPLAHKFDAVPATRSATVDGPGWGWGFRPGPGASFGEFDNRRLKGANRWRLFSGIWLVYLLPGFATAWTEHTGADRWLGLILLAAFCYVYVDPIARALTGQTRWLRWAAPTALAGLCLALLALVGPDALGTVVYVSVA